ncbi:hypothetical protein M0R45_001154 [Rubus argutus]|uniref:Uncharacterized protein n=1 Tax=Rubus argutus TaxID=59490 RepID=A0AAW1VIT5_RUBAR
MTLNMEVDVNSAAAKSADDPSTSNKRRRVIMATSTHGNLGAGDLAVCAPITPCLSLPHVSKDHAGENIMGILHDCQNSLIPQTSEEWPPRFSNPFFNNGSVGFLGTCINFQNPTEALSSPLVPDVAKVTTSFSSACGDITKTGKLVKKPKGPCKLMSGKKVDSHISSREIPDSQKPSVSSFSLGGSSAQSTVSISPCFSETTSAVMATGSLSIAREGRLQTESFPLISRSGEKLGNVCGLFTTDTPLPQLSATNETTNSECLSSGHTPKCSSVMGPVLTHHEP